jgi:hypothetical protein
MKDYEVEVLYQDSNNETQQELLVVEANSEEMACTGVREILNGEGAKSITVCRAKEC